MYNSLNAEATPGEPIIKLDDIAFKQLDKLDMETLVNSIRAGGAVVLPARTDAVEAARVCRARRASLIVCLDDGENIRGVVSPRHVRWEIARVHHRRVLPFSQTLAFMLNNPAERKRKFRHEGNETRISMYECNVIPHYVDGNPCPVHRVPTTKRKFGDWL